MVWSLGWSAIPGLAMNGEAAYCDVEKLRTRRWQFCALRAAWTCAVTDDDVKHLLWLRERLGEAVLDAMVVTTGP